MVERGGLDRGEARDQGRTARFHQHVVQPVADQFRIPARQAQHELRQVRGLRDQLMQRIGRGQRLARTPRLQHLVRMHHHRVQPGRHLQAQRAAVGGQGHAAQQHRCDVVAMAAAAGHRLAGQGEVVQRLARQGGIEQGVGRDQGGDAGGGRAAQPGAQPNALVQREREAERQRQPLAQGDQRRAGGVAGRFQRQPGDAGHLAVDGLDAHFGRVDAAHGGQVARPVDGVSQQVEAHADVADAGRRECSDRHAHACTPTPVLSEWAMASTSPNTPAAVTCGPAPGPSTTSGLSA